MVFTDQELAVLSQLSYCDVPYDRGIQPSLASFLNDEKEYLRSELGASYERVIYGLISKVEGQNYTIVKSVNDKYNTGFAAFAVKAPDNTVTVVCRGTEGFSMDYDSRKDVDTDLQIAFSPYDTDQQTAMEQFMRELDRGGYAGYYFAGHSLGGNLAIHGAVTLRDSSKVLGVTTFNAPGFNGSYHSRHSIQISKIEYRIKNFKNEYDYVSSVHKTPGYNYVVATAKGEGKLNVTEHVGFDDHLLWALKMDENGSFEPNATGQKRQQTYIPVYVTGKIDECWVAYNFITFQASRFDKNKEICRDFSEDIKRIMLGAAQEVEEEQWWQVSKWDVWYRGQDIIVGLGWDLCCGNVDDYYRKLIDVNEASVKDIENIFEKVYGIDDVYTTKISGLIDRIKVGVTTEVKNICDSLQPIM